MSRGGFTSSGIMTAGGSGGTIAFDAFSSSAGGTGNQSWTHTPVGIPNGVIVFVNQAVAVTDQVSSVTYGGVNMTRLAFNTLAGTFGVYAYFLGTGIPTGAQTVLVTVGGAATKVGAAISVTASGDCSNSGLDTSITAGSLTNPSGTIALSSKTSFCAMGFMSGQAGTGGVAPLANWTSRLTGVLAANNVGGIYSYDVIGSSDVTDGWTQTSAGGCAVGVGISCP